ncbi:3 beta-hydroxysteroid dehydrogenase/Delta 5--_4-isomerase [Enhygromyxa salina]|uniref:3 beta-hydroxysteroid dehydrogenase/Delta 5-->4-isomerase n=1 Tax=Enhygromyxa salina TaxID=215803 RepID=A0A2S9YG63_9BACT|nr:NAD-dependent epimerase/dehydratase family protein [Enhygromyxa salina]PRQ04089.1 3 beta-hydroxysteroid dehydrogenase/Delta 5-->4-isomerase [Enhygromyxa salina]
MTESSGSKSPETEFQRVLVTGATGFLGAHVVASLREQGREVVALVRDPGTAAAKRVAALGAELATGDILDEASVEAAARTGGGCTAVLHCAGKVSRDGAEAVLMTKVNVDGVAKVLEACERAGIRRAVVASTSGTIGVSTDPDAVADETTPAPLELINKWPYYRTKYYGEQVALDHDKPGFEVVIVNPALLLGPGDYQGSSTEDVRRALEQRTPLVPAGGYTFVDARDAAHGMTLALDKGRAGQRYLLVSCNCPIRTFYSRIARVAGLDGTVFSLPDHAVVERATRWLVRRAHEVLGEDDALPDEVSIEMAQHYWYVESTLAEHELGWRARDPMITLADTVADLRARGVVMMRAPD